MASSPVFESDFLQRRFNQRKAEARPSRQTSEQQSASSDTSQRRTPGRDDHIFDDPDLLPASRRNTSNPYGSSPAGPAGRRASHSRRTSNLGISVADPQRAMGVREKEDKIQKLDKDNFALKMALVHTQDKLQKLEKRLVDYERLRGDNAELIDINQDLKQELDNRDRAVDEAVVVICDLEEKIRQQQEELDDARPRTARQNNSEGFKNSLNRMPFSTPTEQRTRTESTSNGRDKGLDRTRVSPDVSARMAELLRPEQISRRPRKPVPSFIGTQDAATDALRGMYVEGNKQVRPIPSHASLMTVSVNDEYEDERMSMKSPALSFLSETDFKSLYGKDEPVVELQTFSLDASQGEDRDAEVASQASSQSQRTRASRTDQWVKERGITRHERPSPRRQPSDKFQSLSGVLHDDSPSPERRRTKRPAKATEDTTITAIRQNPIYGQNHFPPTPDTMLTGPSNKSSSSIIRERSSNDVGPLSTQGLASLQPTSKEDLYFAKGTFLPKDADAYASDSDDEHRRKKKTAAITNNSFGESLYQPDGYNSDNGTAVVHASRRYRAPSHGGSHLNHTESRHMPPSRSTANPPRITRSRPPPERPLTVAVEDPEIVSTTIPYGPRRSSIDTPTQASYLPIRRTADPPNTTFALTPTQHGIARPPQAETHAVRRPQVPAQRPSTPPNNIVAVNMTETAAVASAPSRGDSLRQRVANFGRRDSASNSNVSGNNKGENISAPPSVGVNLGQRTRNLFARRNSRSKKGSVSGTSDGRSGSAIESDTEDTGTGAHAAPFLAPLQAAGPSPTPRGRSPPKPPTSNITPTTIPIFPSADLSPPNRTNEPSSNGRQPSHERSGGSNQSWRTAASQNPDRTPEAYVGENNREAVPVSPTLASASAAARTKVEGGARAFPRRGGGG